uniref:Receptor ligand binding region domain-containing protein n=1 Tax=Oryctolagus cuniculus TaxID=9986 RepID=G1U7F1_RABIT
CPRVSAFLPGFILQSISLHITLCCLHMLIPGRNFIINYLEPLEFIISSNTSLFPQLKSKNYQHVLALVFAIEEINRSPHLLPNVSLGYDVFSVLHSNRRILHTPFLWLSGMVKSIPNYTYGRESRSAAVLTGTTGFSPPPMTSLLPVTFGTFDPILSDNGKFPSLYQMAPKEMTLVHGMVSLMLHFGWTWVGLAITDDEKGMQFLSELRAEMDRNGVCIAFLKMIPVTVLLYYSRTSLYHWQIMKSSANVVIIFGDNESFLGLIFGRWKQIMMWKVWVTTSQWDITTGRRHFLLDSFHGALIFSHHHANPSRYPEDPFLADLWLTYFNCSISKLDCKALENCPPNASLEWLPWHHFDVTMTEESYNIYNAVYAVAHAIHEMILQQVEMSPGGIGKGLVEVFSICSTWSTPVFI